MSNLNIQQKVNLLAQKNRDTKVKERDLTDPASKRALFEEEIKPNLSETEQATIKKYLERLAPLGSYKEPEVYDIIKKYDWNEKVLDGIVASMLKKMEDAGNFEGWTEVKQPQKAQPQKAAGKDSKEVKENKGNKKFAKDGSNKRENDTKKGVEGEEQKSYKKRENAESGKREYNEGDEQQEDYYGNNYYGRGNRGGKRQYKQRDNTQQDVYYVKRGKSKQQQQEHVEYVKKGDKKETEQQETTGVREQVVYEVRAPVQETQHEKPKTVAQDKPTRPPVEEERPVQTHQTSTRSKENTSIPHEEGKAVQRPVAQDRTSERANKPIIQPQEQPTVSQSSAKPTVQPEVSQPPVKKPEPVQQTAPTATTTTAATQQVHTVQHTQQQQQQQQQQQHSPAPEVGTQQQQQPQVQGGFPTGGIALKETHPILPFPYIVFPQPNGTCIIQPLPQMMMPQMMPQMMPTQTQEKDPRAGFQQYPVMPGGFLPVSHDKPRQQQQSGNSYLSFPGSEGQHQSQQVNAGSQYPFMPMMFPGSVPVINYGMQQQQQFPTKQGDSATGHHMNPFFQQH